MDNISDCKDTTLFPNNQTFTIFFSNLFYRAFFYHIQNKKKERVEKITQIRIPIKQMKKERIKEKLMGIIIGEKKFMKDLKIKFLFHDC